MKYNVKLHYHTLAIRVQKNHENKLPWYYQLKLCYGSHFLCLMIAAKQFIVQYQRFFARNQYN